MELTGIPLQVVVENKNSFSLNEEALKSILLRDDVKDMKAVVVSIAGAFRRGKSFMLDFFLRYLSRYNSDDWLGAVNVPLSGFNWRGGAERDTTGILMWSEPFKIKIPSGDTVAVLLMDTQGSFDNSTTVKQCATVFALSTMLSSVQVYNIHGNIQEDNLQYLQLFTEYGRLAQQVLDSSCKPFQHLEFLVRDWSYPYDFMYGLRGGSKLLEKKLEIKSEQPDELQSLRRHLKSCFSKLSCHLMPYPGSLVATSPKFDGRISDIDPEFVEELSILVPDLLAPDRLLIKQIHGQELSCAGLMEYFRVYLKIFQDDSLPEPKSMLEATAEANNLNLINTCKDCYKKSMDLVCGFDRPYIQPADVESAHTLNYMEAMHLFETTRKMGGVEFTKTYRDRLVAILNEMFADYQHSNANKNIFQNLRTPGVLTFLLFTCYILNGIFEMIGLSYCSSFVLLPFWVALLSLLTWIYASYSGQMPAIVQVIDAGAEAVADQFIIPAVTQIGRRSLAQSVNQT